MGQTFTNATDAVKTMRANLSPRQIDLEVLERFVDGTQYEGLPGWFEENGVPLWERAPCIVYPLTATAIRSNVDLVLGESRFPALTSNPGEDDSTAGGLDEEESKAVDRALSELLERTRFRSAARQALEHAQGARSIATIVGVRNGRPFLDHVRSRWCEKVDFDADGKVTRLEIRYPYSQAEKQADGTWKLLVRIYRRVIDAVADTTFLPLEAQADGREPLESQWVPDPTLTIAHGLGFCPVHWYAHAKECSTVGQIDGVAIHERLLDEIRGLDFLLSQRQRAALFTADPQLIEKGVDKGYNPSGVGRAASVPATLKGGMPNASNPVTSSFTAPVSNSARVKAPGVVWQYERTDVEVDYLTVPADALKILDETIIDLRNKIAESMSVVILDPHGVKLTGEMSGTAIEMLRGRQFDRCDQIRDDFGANWIMPVIQMLLRVALKTQIRMKSIAAVRKILTEYVNDDARAPLLYLRWPAGYITPDPQDEAGIVNAAIAAKEAGIATTRMAVQKVAPIFGITNVDQAVEQIEEERQMRAAQALEIAQATAPKGEEKPSQDEKEPPKGSEAA